MTVHEQIHSGGNGVTELVAFYAGDAPKHSTATGVEQMPLKRSTEFRFPRGPMAAELVYVKYALEPSVLIPFGMFDEFVLQEKFNEALRIVTALGASHVVSQSVLSDSREVGAEVGARGIGGLRGASRREQRTELNLNYTGTGGPPMDPRPLKWPGEPGFESAITAVMHNGATKVDIRVTSDMGYSIDTDVASNLKKAGFTLGGGYRKARTISYVLEASFPGTTRTKGRLH